VSLAASGALDEMPSNPGAVFEAAIRTEEPAEAQIPRLERQLTRMREELHSARNKALEARKKGPLLIASAVGLGLGLILGLIVGRSLLLPANAVLVMNHSVPASLIVGPKQGRPATTQEAREDMDQYIVPLGL
jgi:hypothetical protein